MDPLAAVGESGLGDWQNVCFQVFLVGERGRCQRACAAKDLFFFYLIDVAICTKIPSEKVER